MKDFLALAPEQDLAALRREAADRFYAIGMSYLPEGWTYKFRKSLSGRCFVEGRNHIDAPKPVTRKSLYIWLHECAHANLHADGRRRPRHVEECEAEMWAHAKMREHGIAVPKDMTRRAKAYVARKIRQAVRRGAKTIDKSARSFSKRKT
jgi:hypothetical protein